MSQSVVPDAAMLNGSAAICSVGQPVELRYGLYAVDRNACLAFACALGAHVLVASFWPAPSDRTPLFAQPQRPVHAPTPEPDSEPVEVEMVVLAPAARPASPDLAPRTPGPAISASRDDEPATIESERLPATRAGARADNDEARPNATAPGGSLAMRGSRPGVVLDPRAGSGLQAAIDGAASDVPGSVPRGDLLGTSPAPPAERSPWRKSGQGPLRATGEPFEASVAADGTIRFRDKPNVAIEGMGTMPGSFVPALSGRFDVTDAVMASVGEVLYPYRKLKLMDQSREMRAGMAAASKRRALDRSLAGYSRRLHRLWRNSNYTLAERKQLLFALWDECAESGDDKVLTTARSIRASTLAFIAQVLPADAPGAYTETELAELNARRQSSAAFAPYPP